MGPVAPQGALVRRSLTRLLAGLGSTLLGCASSLGPAGSYTLRHGGVPSTGFAASSIADLALVDGPANVAVGFEGQVLERVDKYDRAGQWRFQALAGLTHLPRPFEPRLGYEALLGVGAARYYDRDRPQLGAQVGS